MQQVYDAGSQLADHNARIVSLERDLERLLARLDQIFMAALIGAGGAVGGLVLFVFSLLKR
jgi:hypothetical protein